MKAPAKEKQKTAAPAAADKPGKRSIPLSKPIPAHGETVKHLVFREPTGADLADHGVPVRFDFAKNTPDVIFDTPKMTAMLAALAGVPPSSIRMLSATDWTTCAWAITDFFVPDLAALSRMPTA